MKKIKIILILSFLFAYKGKAQVKDISFTLSPAAEYTWWDDKAGIEDNLMLGGKLGFGLGEYVELRAIYLQSIDTKTDFSNYNIVGFEPTLFDAQSITIARWGGEFKANFSTKEINPYLTLGAGVQNIKLDNSVDFEQVYGSLGLGLKFNLAKRIVFALEVKNTTYKFNSGANLLSENDKIDFGVSDTDFENERLSNWSAQGSLQFYLGGRRPGTLSELDKAYLQKFKGGFKGLQWVIEPSIAYIDFDAVSLLRDTYWLGSYIGLDLNEYVGIRAFYFHATQDEKISMDFDKIAMYGGEFRARLNDGNGVTPFITLGGGYLNPGSSYVSVPNPDGTPTIAKGGEFAMVGLGLNIPLGKHILITGGAKAMVTSGVEATDITTTDDIQSHVFYNAGFKFTLGKKSKPPTTVYKENLNKELYSQQQVNNEKLLQLKQEYENKIEGLENDLKLAYKDNDVEKALEILEEKKQAEKSLEEVKTVEKVQEKENIGQKSNEEVLVSKIKNNNSNETVERSKLVQMTPKEFESLIDRILNNIDNEATSSTLNQRKEKYEDDNSILQEQRIQQLNERIEVLEKLLLELNSKQGKQGSTANPNQVDDMNTVIVDKIDGLNKKIDDNANLIKSDKNNTQTIIVTPNQHKNGETIVSDVITYGPTLKYNYTSAMVGFNYGGASTANFGFRLHYDIHKTKLKFMPEAYIGFGEAKTWAMSGNAIYPFKINVKEVEPYVGVGLGFGNLVDNLTGFYNVILGAKLPMLDENLYIDYTMRNSFDYNQIAVGYKLKF